MCTDCDSEPTHKCDLCGHSKPRSEFPAATWNHKAKKERRTLCSDCCEREPTHLCDLCGNAKPRSAFPAAMWNNKAKNTQRTLCNDCCRPKCTATTCNTCKVCRQPHHKRKNCEDEIVALEKSSLPAHVDQLKTWLCSVRKANICSNWPHCQKQRKAKKSQSEAQYTCGECQNLAFTQEEHRKHLSKKK